MPKDFSIYEVVQAIRSDLDKIRNDEALQEGAAYDLSTTDIELCVTVTKAGEGGVRFAVVTGDARFENTRVTRIQLHFTPKKTPNYFPWMTASS